MDEEFRDKLDMLLEYWRVKGTCNVPQKLVCRLEDGREFRLGKWLNRFSQHKRKNKLSIYQLQRLQQLVDEGKLAWSLNTGQIATSLMTDDNAWDERFTPMLKYGDEHGGDCNVPYDYICKGADGTEVKLGKWACNQRKRLPIGTRKDRLAKLQVLVDAGKLWWDLPKPKSVDGL